MAHGSPSPYRRTKRWPGSGTTRAARPLTCGRTGLKGAPFRSPEERWPLPTVTRPRVVAVEDQPGLALRVVEGRIQYRAHDGDWYLPDGVYRPSLSQGLVAALRSLDAEPTETVTDEGEG